MTVERIDAVTGEVVELTEAEARRLTERIRTRLDRVSTAWADLATSITEAYQRRADLALGYGSWAEYAEAELKPSEGLAADVRRQLVGMLSAQGMSTRAIAPTVGRDSSVIRRDLQVVQVAPPEPESERINPATGEVVPGPTYRPTDVTDWTPQEVDDLIDADERELEAWKASTVPAPPKVVGLDGKTYTRPEPKAAEPARRAALPPMVQSAGWDLTKTVDRIQRLADDDRFAGHQKEVAPHLRSHLTHAIEVCQDLLDRINNN